ncbi:GntR family transcriptional regulator [Neobacillus niacini]|nr:GntR family transcriptional regulator [Neobacillus niacini]
MIAADGLMQGDKIPSERELSERLNVGRSSVREALRALELLGLIETRRGEGTFIRDFHGHQLVQLLSTFILQDEKAKSDVYETKYLLEMDCLRLAVKKMDDAMIYSMEKWLSETAQFHDDDFFCQIVQGAENHLFSRIWGILKDYYNALIANPVHYDRKDYFLLFKALAEKNEQKTLSAYCKLRNLSID